MAGDGDFRFPSTMRLKKKDEFIRVFRKGAAWKGSYFSLHLLPRADGVPPHRGDVLPKDGDVLSKGVGPRLGIVATRKVGSAVERNRIKRKIREAFRKSAHRLPAVDLVIRPNRSCKEATETLITRSLVKAVRAALDSVKERT